MADKLEKKRKRSEGEAGRPKKKVLTSPAVGTVKVEFIQTKGGPGPVLASTPGLNFPSEISFKAYKNNKILPGQTSQELLLQSSEHSRLDYTITQEKDGSSESLLKDYVGVFDPTTQTLQVVEVPKLTLRSTLRSEMEELREERERIAAVNGSMTAKRHALAAEFGSRKSRKAIANLTENAISRGRASDTNAGPQNEAVASAVLQGMSSTTSAMPTREDLAAAVDSSKPRPIANIAAEFPSDVYPIDTIVGKDLLSIIPIKDWVDAATEGRAVNVASKFVAKRMFKLAKHQEIQKLKVLHFILLCVNFNAALKKGKGAKLVPFKDKLAPLMGEDTPGPVVDAIRRKFASENNDMTRWHIDNLMTHVAAAALVVDGFEVDVNDLREDLKLENREIKQYFHEIGCRVAPPTETERSKLKLTKAESVNHNVAKLKLPLSFPKVRTGPSKRR